MAVTQSFYDAVKENDVKTIRIMMKDSLLSDPSFTLFEQMREAAQNVVGLFEEHDGTALTEDRDQWNDRLLSKLMVQLVNNFSEERVNHLKKVVAYLEPEAPIKHQNPEEYVCKDEGLSDYQRKKKEDKVNGRYIATGTAIGAGSGILIGAIIVGAESISGLAAAGTIIGAGVLGAAAGAGIAYKLSSK